MTESEEKKSTRSRGINARQSQILDFIRQYIFNNGYPPSVREIGSAVGLSSSASVHNNLKKLAEKLEARAMKRSDSVKNAEFWGLVAFVGIPLPGTGAWTGSLVAALLDIDFKKAVLAELLGVAIATVIMSFVSYGLLGALLH